MTYNVYEIENLDKKSKNYKRKYYVVSTKKKSQDVLSRMRSMATSDEVMGGPKLLGKDMKKTGKKYFEKYVIRKRAKGLGKGEAEGVRGSLIDKAGGADQVYNVMKQA